MAIFRTRDLPPQSDDPHHWDYREPVECWSRFITIELMPNRPPSERYSTTCMWCFNTVEKLVSTIGEARQHAAKHYRRHKCTTPVESTAPARPAGHACEEL